MTWTWGHRSLPFLALGLLAVVWPVTATNVLAQEDRTDNVNDGSSGGSDRGGRDNDASGLDRGDGDAEEGGAVDAGDEDRVIGRQPGDRGQAVDSRRSDVQDARRDLAPVRREEIAGNIVFIDPEERLLELAGPVIELTRKTRILGPNDRELPLKDFLLRAEAVLESGDELPLVAVAVRRGRGDHRIATQIRLLGTDTKFDRHGDVAVGPLVGLGDGLIELLGPAFTVGENARLQVGREASDLDALLELIEASDEGFIAARMEVRPGDGDLPVVETLVVAPQAGEVQVRGGAERDKRSAQDGVRILNITPFDGETEVGFENENGDIEATIGIELNVPVRRLLQQDHFKFELLPPPVDHGGLEVEENAMFIDVLLAPETAYQLNAALPGVGHFFSVFTTGSEILKTSITGSVLLPGDVDLDAFSVDRSVVIITEENPLEVLADDPDDIEQLLDVAVAVVPLGRAYEAVGMALGEYYVYAHIVVEIAPQDRGRSDERQKPEIFFLSGLFDADGDGEPDVVEVADGDLNPTADITLQLPEPFVVEETSPANRETEVGGGDVTIEITFNKPIGDVDIEDMQIHPEPLNIGDLEISDDGFTLLFDVGLEEDTIYGVALEYAEDEDGEPLGRPYSFVFATGTIPAGGIAGRLFLPRDLPVRERIIKGPAVVELFRVIDGDHALPRRTFLSFDGDFNFAHVPDGDWTVSGFVEVALPKGVRPGRVREAVVATVAAAVTAGRIDVPAELVDRVNESGFDIEEARKRFEFHDIPRHFDRVEFFGVYDADGDGKPDAITIANGEVVDDIPIFLRPLKQRRDRTLRVVETSPETGETIETDGDISLTFNAALFTRGRHVAIDPLLVPHAESGPLMQNYSLSEDGKTITWPVELAEYKRYRLLVAFAEGAEGRLLVDPFELRFNTRVEGVEEEELGDVSGTITLSDGIIDDAEVVLFTRGLTRRDRIDVVSIATVDEDGDYAMEEVPVGEYRTYVEVLTAAGQELFQFYDADGNGEPDAVVVTDGATTADIDIEVQVTIIDENEVAVSADADSNETVSLDLNPEAGNNRRNALSDVVPGGQISVGDVQDLKDVSGYTLTLSYDPGQLEFASIAEATDDEDNFLATNDGTPVFLPPILGTASVEFGGAILGADDNTAVDGEGLIASVTFNVLNNFVGTVFSVEQTVFDGLNYLDTLSIPVSAAVMPPLEQLQQEKGPVSFDFDEASADQGQLNRGFIDPGTEFQVAVYLNGVVDTTGVTDASNYGVTVQYEPDQLTYIGFEDSSDTESNFLAAGGGTAIALPPILGAASVEFGNAILGPTTATAPEGKGLIGVLSFAANDDFSQSDLIITQYSVKSVGGDQETFNSTIIGRVAAGEIDLSIPAGELAQQASSSGTADADFDGNGAVDFFDFFQFADAFGQEVTEENEKFNLDGVGPIDFGDFFLFADAFGAAKVVPSNGTDSEGSLSLAAEVTDYGVSVRPQLDTAVDFDRFGYVVRYDPRLLSFERFATAELLAAEVEPGVIMVSSAPGEGELRFAAAGFDTEALENASLELESAVVRGLDGTLHQLATGNVDKALPVSFGLTQNYPNPFNPATTIRYQLPTASPVRLEIYDVLGQRIRTLVNEVKPAGFYTISWRGMGDGGRSAASGIYFYRLQAQGFTDVKKLLLIK